MAKSRVTKQPKKKKYNQVKNLNVVFIYQLFKDVVSASPPTCVRCALICFSTRWFS